jgi:hypothetical protein
MFVRIAVISTKRRGEAMTQKIDFITEKKIDQDY